MWKVFNLKTHLMYKITLSIIVCLLLAFLSTSYSLSGEKKQDKTPFSELIITSSDTHLLLFGVVDTIFTDEMMSALKSGLPIHFNFHVELFNHNEDKAVALQDFYHSLTYDTLKDSYAILLDEANAKVIQTKDIKEAKNIMKEINGLKVVELSRLQPDSQYKLRIRADLFEKTLPMGIHRVLPFISSWGIETDWQELEFNY